MKNYIEQIIGGSCVTGVIIGFVFCLGLGLVLLSEQTNQTYTNESLESINNVFIISLIVLIGSIIGVIIMIKKTESNTKQPKYRNVKESEN